MVFGFHYQRSLQIILEELKTFWRTLSIAADLTAEFCCILMLVWAWPRWLEWVEPGGCGRGASSRLLCGLQAGEQSVLSLSCRRMRV